MSVVVVSSQSRVEALTGMRAYKQKLLFKGVLADAQVSWWVVVGYRGRGLRSMLRDVGIWGLMQMPTAFRHSTFGPMDSDEDSASLQAVGLRTSTRAACLPCHAQLLSQTKLKDGSKITLMTASK